MKYWFLAACFVCNLIFAQNGVNIERDDKGVWFITGPEDAKIFDIYEAMGYAVATDRLWQAEKYRRAARGKLAEVFGADQLESDIFTRTIGYSDEELQNAFDESAPEVQELVSGYVAGFNRRIAEVRKDIKLLPFEFFVLGVPVEDWSVLDVLAWSTALQRNFDPEATEFQQLENAKLLEELYKKYPKYYQQMFEDLRWNNDPKSQTYIPSDGKKALPAHDIKVQWQRIATSNIGKAADSLVKKRRNIIENQQKINAYVKMGSYAWAVSGKKTASGNPIVYSGPQMGFSVPAIVLEGSIRAGGLNISGMTVAGIPGIIIGRTPHHAWSMQVGHAHTVDFYLEKSSNVQLHRVEVIKVKGGEDVQLPVYRSSHGPIVHPMPFQPQNSQEPAVAWKYSHWNHELKAFHGWLGFMRAKSMDEFGKAIEYMGVSQHFTYVDCDGNIAYWMSGRNPKRPAGEYRFPQPIENPLEWDSSVLIPRSTDRNTAQGYYGGWNNKSSVDYDNSYNNDNDIYGPFHRAHVITDYLSNNDSLSFEQIRDLALHIATTNSFHGGGVPWQFVEEHFTAAVKAYPNKERLKALKILKKWDGHFVEGDKAAGKDKADAWILMQNWIENTIQMIFADELKTTNMSIDDQRTTLLFNALLHALDSSEEGIQNNYNWFSNADSKAPQEPQQIIVQALDKALADLGEHPWGLGQRGTLKFKHDILGVIHETPFSKRSTYAHVVEMGPNGPVRIESMFPLGQSGNIYLSPTLKPTFDKHFFDMAPLYDAFAPRNFPIFEQK